MKRKRNLRPPIRPTCVKGCASTLFFSASDYATTVVVQLPVWPNLNSFYLVTSIFILKQDASYALFLSTTPVKTTASKQARLKRVWESKTLPCRAQRSSSTAPFKPFGSAVELFRCVRYDTFYEIQTRSKKINPPAYSTRRERGIRAEQKPEQRDHLVLAYRTADGGRRVVR